MRRYFYSGAFADRVDRRLIDIHLSSDGRSTKAPKIKVSILA